MYIATFHDYSYGLGSLMDDSELVRSIVEAKRLLKQRYESGWSPVRIPDWFGNGALNLDDVEHKECVHFPCVTPDASMELYPVQSLMWGKFPAPEPTIRLTIGPRGGIREERF